MMTDRGVSPAKQRVVISGIGVLSPIGNNKKEHFASLAAGKSGIAPLTLFNTDEYRCKIGGEIKNIDFTKVGLSNYPKIKLDRASKIVLMAARQALDDAGLLQDSPYAPERCSIVMGTTLGGMISGQRYHTAVRAAKDVIDTSLVMDYLPGSLGDLIAVEYGFKQSNICISTACSSGTHSLGYGYQMIQTGRSDLVVAGGADTMSSFTCAGFGILRVVDSGVTRPFSKNRAGLNLGEAAAILTLESLDHARARGAHIYAEIIGYGASCDAYHMTAPGPEGGGAARAMNLALTNAGIDAQAVDYINAHGTGTKFNDLYESMAIRKVFGERAANIPVSSTKSMTGHTLGAAGSLEAISAIFSLENQYIHPTVHHDQFDEKCGLDVVPNVGRSAEVNVVMSNSFGFGGNNAVLVLKRCDSTGEQSA